MTTTPIVISMSGKLGSGKDTFAEYLYMYAISKHYGVASVTFAMYFKKMISDIFNIDISYFYDRSKKEEIIPGMLVSPREVMLRFSDFVQSCKPTHFLDEGRTRIIDAIRLLVKTTQSEVPCIVIVTDTRMPREFDMLSSLDKDGVIALHKIIVRRDTGIVSVADGHESEVTINEISSWDYEVNNDKTLDDLKRSAEEILDAIVKEVQL